MIAKVRMIAVSLIVWLKKVRLEYENHIGVLRACKASIPKNNKFIPDPLQQIRKKPQQSRMRKQVVQQVNCPLQS